MNRVMYRLWTLLAPCQKLVMNLMALVNVKKAFTALPAFEAFLTLKRAIKFIADFWHGANRIKATTITTCQPCAISEVPICQELRNCQNCKWENWHSKFSQIQCPKYDNFWYDLGTMYLENGSKLNRENFWKNKLSSTFITYLSQLSPITFGKQLHLPVTLSQS